MRLAQYEQIVVVFVDAHTGFCMDTQLGGKWRLPDAAVNSSPVPANIESPVRQAHDDCLAAFHNDDLRVVGALRLALENQRRVAMANERLALARRCLQQTGVPAARKQCLEHATGDTLTETQWKRWNVLHQLWLRSA
ncbi:hypothetical protein GCM10022212_18300 [Actimicrobium antarcticum]|uniref:DUF222 domain-containing protein n=1 Tax=Actimicrobium antarcticum TaxID=1051899 RepID=A0ABP7T6M1_9BURK